VQVGKFAFEQQMQMAVARDVAGAAGTGPDRPQRLFYRREDRRVLAHAEIVVRAPHRDLGADAVIIGARKAAAAPLEIGEDSVPPLGAQRVEALSEKTFVIHSSPQSARALPYTIYFARQLAARGTPRRRAASQRPTFRASRRLQLLERPFWDFDRAARGAKLLIDARRRHPAAN
jgi:hypothetical protein